MTAVAPLGLSEPVLTFPGQLALADLETAAGPVHLWASAAALAAVRRCHLFVENCVAAGRPVYGSTTGYGALVGFSGRVNPDDQSRGLIDFLSVGQGPALPPGLARAMLLARTWSLAQARSGVSPSVLTGLVNVLRSRIAPVVPEYGSVGASGDLVPLAHATAALMGRGEVMIDGVRLPAAQGLAREGIEPLRLTARDGLALVNGTSLTSAAAGLAGAQAGRSVGTSLSLACLLFELLGVGVQFASESLLAAAGHQGGVDVAAGLRARMEGATVSGGRPLQEPYSMRCVPQLVGAVRTSVEHANAVVLADLNGVSDNPVFFPELDEVVHGGNFFGQPVAFAADLLSSALTQLGTLAERQLDLLMDPNRNGGLHPSLSAEPGQQHGLTGVQIATTAIVAAMRRATTPAAVQSISTNQHNQDVVPFGTQAAITAGSQAEKLRWVHGALAVGLRQAFHLAGKRPTSLHGAALFDRLCAVVAPVSPDRPLDIDVRAAADLLDELHGGGARCQACGRSHP